MRRLGLTLSACLLLASCRFGYGTVSFNEDDDSGLAGDGDGAGGGSGGTETDGAGGSSDGAGGASTGGASSGGSSSGGMAGETSSGGASSSGGMTGSGGTPPIWGEVTGLPKDYCSEVAQLDAAPVLDGLVDPGVYLQSLDPKGWTNEMSAIPAGNSISFGVAWRPDGVYYFIVVSDTDYVQAAAPSDVMDDVQIYEGDGIEFYVDHDGVFDAPEGEHAEFGTRQFFVSSPPDATSENTDRGMIRRNSFAPDPWDYYDPALWVSKPIPGGYIIEGFVNATSLNLGSLALAQDDFIGMNVGHNVSGPMPTEGNRLGQYFFRLRQPEEGNSLDYPFQNEAAFCRTKLIVE